MYQAEEEPVVKQNSHIYVPPDHHFVSRWFPHKCKPSVLLPRYFFMGKNGGSSWFDAVKRVFRSPTKDKQKNRRRRREAEHKHEREEDEEEGEEEEEEKVITDESFIFDVSLLCITKWLRAKKDWFWFFAEKREEKVDFQEAFN